MDLDPQEELAPDLEWMLQSSQAPQALLLEALVEERYAPLLRLAQALLLEPGPASQAVNTALAAALARAYSYRTRRGVEDWLAGLLLEACAAQRRVSRPVDWDWPAYTRLDLIQRAAAALAYLCDWQPARIAALLRRPEKRVRQDLVAFQRLYSEQGPPGWGQPPGPPEAAAGLLPELLRGWFRERFPLQEISAEQSRQAAQEIAALAGRQERRRSLGLRAAEITAVLLAVLAAAASIWGVNRLLPDTAPTSQPLLVTRVVYVTPTPRIVVKLVYPPTFTPVPADAYVIVRPSDSLAMLAKRLGVSVGELIALNRLAPGARLEAGQRLLNPKSWPAPGQGAATLVPTQASRPPLDQAAEAGQLLQRLLQHNVSYNTLWFDARLVDYGPEDYIGPPRVQRVQAWLGDEQSLVLIGEPDGSLEEVWLRQGEQVLLARPGSPDPWAFERLDGHSRSRSGPPAGAALRQMAGAVLNLSEFSSAADLRVAGRNDRAAQPALVVDQIDANGLRVVRYELDDRTGLVLSKIVYGQPYPLTKLELQRVAYNVDFPQDLLDARLPWRGGFATGAGGQPEAAGQSSGWEASGRLPLQPLTAPEGFDPAGSALVFQYERNFKPGAAFGNVSLFALPPATEPGATPGASAAPVTAYRLAELRMGNPWRLACARSPDGEWIAYVNQPQAGIDPDSLLNWVRLGAELDRAVTNYYPAGVTSFAFSPDSQSLAFFGHTNLKNPGSLYVQELLPSAAGGSSAHSEPQRELMRLASARSLVWSPDGRWLALLARLRPDAPEEMLLVLDAASGALQYQAPYAESGNKLDAPPAKWGVEFPVRMGGLEACARPPGP